MKFLQGKKTYIVAVLFLLAMILPVFHVVIPEWAWGILAALGLAAVRSAIQSISGVAGWKTYVAAAVVAGISICHAAGVIIPPQVIDIIYGICGSLGIVGIRDAIQKIAEA